MMKKRMFVLALCALMVCSMFLMSGCKDDKDDGSATTGTGSGDASATGPSSTEANYKVTVVDGVGVPYTKDLMVTILKDGEKVTMMPISDKGSVEKVLAKADYTVEVTSTDPSVKLYFDAGAAKLSAEKTDLQLVVSKEVGEDGLTIVAPSLIEGAGQLEFQALNIDVGSTHVKLTGEDRNYFLFVPRQAGVYELSVSNDVATLGVYGGTTAYITSTSQHNIVDNKATITIYESMVGQGDTGTNVLVIGLDVEADSECILNVIRTQDTPWTVEEEPWQKYNVQMPISPFTLEEGVELAYFDVTAPEKYDLVLNEETGCYHLNSVDGPRVFVQMANEVYSVSMKNIVGEIVYDENGVLIPNGVAPFRYYYDNGPDDFFKEEYTDVMQQYVTDRDKKTGVYPMTKDLYYILPMGIDHAGWLKEGTNDYLFGEVQNVNPENAWLFFCQYEVMEDKPAIPDDPDDPSDDPGTDTPVDPKPQDPIKDNEDEPIVIGSTLNFDAEVKANHIVYYDLMRVTDTILTIKDKDAYVIYNGTTYEAKNGVVTVPKLYSPSPNTPIKVAIGNKGTSDKTFAITLSYPSGHQENPKQLKFETLTIKTTQGDSAGVYYSWTATADGTLTITLDSCSSPYGAKVAVDQTRGNIPVQHIMDEDESGSTTLTIKVKAGDKIVLCVNAKADENSWSVPAATIKVTPSFE